MNRGDDGCIPLGQRDPATGRLVLSPKRTLPTAEAYVRDYYNHPDGRTLHSHAGLFLAWWDNRFVEVEDEAVKHCLQEWLHRALRYQVNRDSKEMELVDFESNPNTVNAALATLKAHVHLPVTVTSPSWLRDDSSDPTPDELLPCRTVLLHLPTMKCLAPTPAFFTMNALEIAPDPNAEFSMQWMEFLHQLFDGDTEALDLLQEWCGYCLTGNTSLQKMLFLVGPRRSGKGTIARVLT